MLDASMRDVEFVSPWPLDFLEVYDRYRATVVLFGSRAEGECVPIRR
jgi:predicted nucleotidyltransferase